jgi:hypothetical protein
VSDVLSLLGSKLKLLKRVYRETKDVTFVGDDNDAQRYVDLYEARQSVFAEIYKIDAQLPEDKKSFGTEAEAVLKQIKDTVSGIVELDKEVLGFAEKSIASLKGSIKGINVGKSLSAGYSQNLSMIAGQHFDTRK